nr:MAG TPA: hypothetical protein [Caudoviricetes sp.]
MIERVATRRDIQYATSFFIFDIQIILPIFTSIEWTILFTNFINNKFHFVSPLLKI